MSAQRFPEYAPAGNRQRGQAALLTVLLLVGVGVTAIVYTLATPAKISIENDKKTAAALAQAKAALIGYAIGSRLDETCPPTCPQPTPRVGDLPCPDIDNNGTAGSSCSNAGGTTLGRLPWKSLGLPDLRDGNGERLWYAVSENFKKNPAVGTLNSDTYGTITVRGRDGSIINDGTYPPSDPYSRSGVVAVIIAPGAVLKRLGASDSQDRSCSGDSNMTQCQTTGDCSSTTTALCNPINYLDTVGPPVLTVAGATGSTEDNANFLDSGGANGFIHGDIHDANRQTIVNDRLITITYQELMPLMERRVAKEALNCLNTYASVPRNSGRYPWAAPISGYPSYADQTGVRFGRIPDSFGSTLLGVGGIVAAAVCPLPLFGPTLCMSTSWPNSCALNTGTWWSQWKELVFYGVAESYQPGDPLGTILSPLSILLGGTSGGFLTVNPPSNSADKRAVVIVAGKSLSATTYPAGGNQPRSTTANKQSITNYLEGENDGGLTDTYTQRSTTSSFNDILLYQQ